MKMKRFSVLFLALAMVLGLAACGGGNGGETPDLTGQWECKVDTDPIIASTLDLKATLEDAGLDTSGTTGLDDISFGELKVLMDLKEDGTFAMSADRDWYNTVADSVTDWFKDNLEPLFLSALEAECKKADITMDELKAALGVSTIPEMLAKVGLDQDEFVEGIREEIMKELDNEDVMQDFEQAGTWEFKSGKIHVTMDGDKDVLKYNAKDDTITAISTEKGVDDMVFTRVK